MCKVTQALVYNYKKGRKEPSVCRLVIGKFYAGYLCIKGKPDRGHSQRRFETEWFAFMEKS